MGRGCGTDATGGGDRAGATGRGNVWIGGLVPACIRGISNVITDSIVVAGECQLIVFFERGRCRQSEGAVVAGLVPPLGVGPGGFHDGVRGEAIAGGGPAAQAGGGSSAKIVAAVTGDVGEANRAKEALSEPSCGVSEAALDRVSETVALPPPALNSGVCAGTDGFRAVAEDVGEADRGVVCIIMPAGAIGEARADDLGAKTLAS